MEKSSPGGDMLRGSDTSPVSFWLVSEKSASFRGAPALRSGGCGAGNGRGGGRWGGI